jgi:hypothetical protein
MFFFLFLEKRKKQRKMEKKRYCLWQLFSGLRLSKVLLCGVLLFSFKSFILFASKLLSELRLFYATFPKLYSEIIVFCCYFFLLCPFPLYEFPSKLLKSCKMAAVLQFKGNQQSSTEASPLHPVERGTRGEVT